VLKPGGKLLLLEHQCSPFAQLAFYQVRQMLTPFLCRREQVLSWPHFLCVSHMSCVREARLVDVCESWTPYIGCCNAAWLAA